MGLWAEKQGAAQGGTVEIRDAVIVGAARTAFGKRNGALRDVHPVDLSADLLTGLLSRSGVDPEQIDDVIWGCVTQLGDQSSNVARFATLAAGWPDDIPGVTVNRACGSSQQALDFAAFGVMSGNYDMVVAGGVESMSRVPLGAAREVGQPYGPRVLERYDNFSFNQGLSAELVADKWCLSRSALDQYSVESHHRAARAIDQGAFLEQIVPISVGDVTFNVDEGVRRDSSLESLARLKPVFKEDGVIHAGNSSQISDGASALLVTTAEYARKMGLTPLVRFHSSAVTGADPVLMLTGPIAATQKVLSRAGVDIADVGAYEVNEAFAPVPLAWLAEIGADPERLNPSGGAIALGHPLGASGTGLLTRMIYHMRDQSLKYGLVAMCEGGGTANATLIELVS
jgi:acetyl-CoA acyltransferase